MIEDDADGATFEVRVIPRAGRTLCAGMRNGALLVRLAAAPVDGAANNELISFLADALNLPKQQLALISGAKARTKRVRVMGVRAAMLAPRLHDLAHGR